MRIRDYTVVSIKDIIRQPIRSSLTILALAISATILVALTSISIGGQQAITKELGLDESLNTIIVTPNIDVSGGILGGNIQLSNADTEKLDDSTVEKLSGIGHVALVKPQVSIWEFKYFLVDGIDKSFVAKASSIASKDMSSGAIQEMNAFMNSPDSNQVILGYSYAKELGYELNPNELIGKDLVITTQNGYRGDGAEIPLLNASRQTVEKFNASSTVLRAKIVEVSSDAMYKNQILIPMSWANKIKTPMYYGVNGLSGENQITKTGYSNIVIQSDNVDNVQSISGEIEGMHYGVLSTQKQIERINQYILVMWVVLGSIAIISLVVSCLGIANTMFMTISEEKYVIGVWRACGARKSVVHRLFIFQTAILGAIGGLIGVTMGYFVSYFVNNQIELILRAQGMTDLNIANPTWLLIWSALGLTIVLSTLSGLYPAHKAASQDPSKALSSI
jgi:putative ABC transport system permease protein